MIDVEYRRRLQFGVVVCWWEEEFHPEQEATNGAPGIATNGAIGRYERGSWPYY